LGRMDYAWFLFDFDGRINRAKFWLSALIIMCWMLFLSLLVAGTARRFGGSLDAFGFDTSSIVRIVDPTAPSAFEIIRNGRSTSADNLIPLTFYAIGTPLFLWIYLATSVKRLRDRNKSAWWMIPFFVIPGLFCQFEDRLPYSYPARALAFVVALLCVWGFVEMCCLRGTIGPNRYGADPLARAG
jgi:uncharacterized membrane protein YhaH (DUF805 family)